MKAGLITLARGLMISLMSWVGGGVTLFLLTAGGELADRMYRAWPWWKIELASLVVGLTIRHVYGLYNVKAKSPDDY